MSKTTLLALASTAMLFIAAPAIAQKMEAVHAINYDSTEQAQAALGALVQDPAVKGARVTLYAKEFGASESSHLIVEDADDYGAYMTSRNKRQASPGWSRFMLATNDNSEYLNSQLVLVVDDYGAPRHTAGYLAAFLIESLLLALVGGIAGLLIASFLQAFTITTMNWQSFSQLAFGFHLTPAIVASTLLFSLFMGLVGGFLPSVRAARLEIVDSLRAA